MKKYFADWQVGALLLVGFALRAWLVLAGGQYFLVDEWRFNRGFALVDLLRQADILGFVRYLLTNPDHFGFQFVSLPIAALESLFRPDAQRASWLAGLCFALISTANLWLIYRIAYQTSRSTRQAKLALFFAVCAITLLYYARHLMPYDSALLAGLLALYFAVRERPRWQDSLWCGFFASLAFSIYQGYWAIAGIVMLMHFLRALPSFPRLLARSLLLTLAFFALPLAFVVGARLLTDSNFYTALVKFSQTVHQGDFSEGWRFPFLYFWDSERGMFVLWLIGLVAGLALWVSGIQRAQLTLWLGAVLGMYLALAAGASVFHKFVLYSRTVRQLSPFVCLLLAVVVEHAWQWLPANARRPGAMLGVAGLCVLAVANFLPVLALTFPGELKQAVLERYADVSVWSVIDQPLTYLPVDSEFSVYDPGAPTAYVLTNAEFFYPLAVKQSSYPPGEKLFCRRHPLQFRAYLYEGYTPQERELLTSTDLSMCLVKTP